MKLPEPFQRVIELDAELALPVVQIAALRARRTARRYCQVFLSAPAMGGGVRA